MNNANNNNRTSPPTPTASAPSSPTHKRRRTDLQPPDLPLPPSPTSSLRNAVRAALAQESSPTARSTRLKQVYDRFRLRAIHNARAKTNNSTSTSTTEQTPQQRPRIQTPTTTSHHQQQHQTDSNVNHTSNINCNSQQTISTNKNNNNNHNDNNNDNNDSHQGCNILKVSSASNTTATPSPSSASSSPSSAPPSSCCNHKHGHDHGHGHGHDHGCSHTPRRRHTLTQTHCHGCTHGCAPSDHNSSPGAVPAEHTHTGNDNSNNNHSPCCSNTQPQQHDNNNDANGTTVRTTHTHGAPYREAPPGVFPGKGARPGCDHYERGCWIKAACCGKYYPCRRCHDEHETHEIDRHATQLVACVHCGDMDQPVAESCRTCHKRFARYFCSVCKFYDDRPGHDAYHCDGCGICRVGKGLGIDNYHCNRCGNCVPIDAKDSHPCRERSLDSNCPICTHYLATSTEQVVFLPCGHCMHVECLNQHTASGFYTCPICHKAITDMSDWYRALDVRLAQDVIPPEYVNRMSTILCHDCDVKNDVPFHFVYHKCPRCKGYNTRVLAKLDRPPTTGADTAAVGTEQARTAPASNRSAPATAAATVAATAAAAAAETAQ